MKQIKTLWLVLGFVWSLPNTLIGFIIGAAGYLVSHITGDKSARIKFDRGLFLFEYNPALVKNSALCLGFSHLYSSASCQILNNGTLCKDHEDQHTIQSMVLGPFFLPIYALCAIIAMIRGSNPIGPRNLLELGPYSCPPRPWPRP
ncbi:MAG: hypothetical protein V3V30_01710 [Parvularculaceae bacterium]